MATKARTPTTLAVDFMDSHEGVVKVSLTRWMLGNYHINDKLHAESLYEFMRDNLSMEAMDALKEAFGQWQPS